MTDAVHLQELVGGRLRRRLAQARPAGLLLAGSGHGAAAAEAEHLLDLLGGVVLGAAEHVGAGDALAAQLVHLHHLAVGDQPDEGVGRQQGQRHLQTLLQRLQLLVIHAGVHHQQEYRGHVLQTENKLLPVE